MNVCTICNADGVFEALGTWYCKDHLIDGLLDVAEFVDRVGGYDFTVILEDSMEDGEPEPAARPFWGPPTGPKA